MAASSSTLMRKRYCEREQITFTRSRPYKKNDSAHIEQKNWDVIPKMIGYGRFDTYEQLDIIKRRQSLLTFYQNYFQPSQKLISKTPIGAKVTKKYDPAQTPVARLLARKDKQKHITKRLNDTFRQLNPVALIRDINELVSQLYDTLRFLRRQKYELRYDFLVRQHAYAGMT